MGQENLLRLGQKQENYNQFHFYKNFLGWRMDFCNDCGYETECFNFYLSLILEKSC